MTLTEAAARQKLCPVRPLEFVAAIERGIKGPRSLMSARCVASDCMMWRAIETLEFKNRAENEFRRSGMRLNSDTGHCGLAPLTTGKTTP